MRLWVAGCSEQERSWVPLLDHESWLCLMQEVELLRVPLLFGRAHAIFKLSEGGAVATKNVGDSTMRTAASKVVMRSGRHFVRFTVIQGDNMSFGVIRPGWDVEGGTQAHREDAHCFYLTGNGQRVAAPRPRRLQIQQRGGDAEREGAGRPHRHAARPRSGQHDRLEERREAGDNAARRRG